MTIDIEIIQSERGNESRSPFDGILRRELIAKIACRQSGVHTLTIARLERFQSYPPSFPMGLAKQSDREGLCLTPLRIALVGANSHLPIGVLVVRKPLSLIRNP